MKSLISYLKNVRGEFQHIVWPKPRVALAHTLLIILISAVIAVFIGLLDYALTSIVGFLIAQ
jgi:preprotein translocase SecE subunit